MKRVWLLLAVQAGTILGWAAAEEAARRSAPTFRVPMQALAAREERQYRLQPVDLQVQAGAADTPLTLAEVERFLDGATEFHGPALVGFCESGAVHRVCALARHDDAPGERPAQARYWSRARVTVLAQEGWRVRADFVATRAFLPPRLALPAPENAPGWTLELAHREGRPPLPLRLRFEGRLVFES